jgi:hypothetical protein
MIDDATYHWLILETAAQSAAGGPLATQPFVDAALRFFGYSLEPAEPGDVVRAVCAEVLTRRMILMGDDD